MDTSLHGFDPHLSTPIHPGLEESSFLMRSQGWVLFPSVIPAAELGGIRAAVIQAVAECGHRQVESGATDLPDGTAHHTVGRYPALDAFLARHWLHAEIDDYFGGVPYILHAFNPATVAPLVSSYLHRIHRDVRTHAGDFRLLLNMLVMVDPFTAENGATHVLSGSHHSASAPAEHLFRRDAKQLIGPAGSIVLFDSNLWHAAGANTSSQSRVALTLSFSRPFVKQQMDYPRFLGSDYGQALSAPMRQLLGYNAMVPVSYDEFYCKREQRLYRSDQG